MIKKIILFVFLSNCLFVLPSEKKLNIPSDRVEELIQTGMKEGDIPGVSVIIFKNGHQYIKNYGFSSIHLTEPINSKTLFELGSCSKAFTGLAILKLESEKKIKLDNYISDYLSWFKMYYEDSTVKITIRQALHHTSGIPWHTLSLIPQGNEITALEQTVKNLSGTNLRQLPGENFEYATINYDILGLIIESVTNLTFEEYIEKEILKELLLHNTYVGYKNGIENCSKGHKIGFFKPRLYNAPVYRGNNPAAYFISNAEDVAKWMSYQMGLLPCKFDSLIISSHKRDETVTPFNLSSYGTGWNISLKGDGQIFHSGLNPNFTSYIAFNKKEGNGVAILANSNSAYTNFIGKNIMRIISGEKVKNNFIPDNSNDKAYSVVSIVFSIYLLFVFIFIFYVIYRILKGKRKFEALSVRKIRQVIVVSVLIIPFLAGIYVLPKAMANFSWESALVWSPISFKFSIVMAIASILTSYLVYIVTVLFPEKNQYIRNAPGIILLSILTGLSNMAVILLITSSLRNPMDFKYLTLYFGLSMVIYLGGRKYVQTKMIYLSRNIVYDLRMKLLNKVFLTKYENFEKVDRGRIYTTMNDDIGTIGTSANTFVGITTSIITAGGAFLYMATIAFWATLITVLLIGTISTIYYIVSRKTQVLFEDARETRTVYMRLLNGMVDGFKELSLHIKKKTEYKAEVEKSTDEYRRKISAAHVKFVNAFLVGESLLIFVLAVVSFIIPKIFPDIQFYILMNFVVILLYLIGPINNILGAVPAVMQLKIAWGRVQGFINDIPSSLNLNNSQKNNELVKNTASSLVAKNLSYNYNGNGKSDGFSVGPINLELKKGEALFIIGGNGSGKTTLAKLLTGLYTPRNGEILVNDSKVNSNEIGEYFSTVFRPAHLFQKMYDTDLSNKEEYLKELLITLQLQDKVKVIGNEYSTTDLSGGQRSRLLLLQCYLEEKPIYLFDEWAADQDPEYRKFFYRELLTRMKREGKIIIAITHDDHYFDVADKILKMDLGKVEYIKGFENEKEMFSHLQ